jgi:hypothetical protein
LGHLYLQEGNYAEAIKMVSWIFESLPQAIAAAFVLLYE